MSEGAWTLVSAVIWWGGVWFAYAGAREKGRNRWGWPIAAMFAPIIVPLVVWLLPERKPARV